MNKKMGVSLIIVSTAVAIMLLLISVASVVGTNAIKSANFDEYMSVLNRVSDEVNMYYIENDRLPISSQSVVNYSTLPVEFKNTLSTKNDVNNKLFLVDVSLLKDKTIDKGKGTFDNKDVFLVAEDTHNVYYLKGFKYKSKMYYGV